MPRAMLWVLFGAAGLGGCASGPRPACRPARPCPAAAAGQAGIIPAQILMANRGESQYRISRAGDRIAWLRVDGVTQTLMTRRLGRGRARRLVQVSGGWLWPWQLAPDGRSLLYMVDDQGDERWRLRQVFTDGSRDRELLLLGARTGAPIAMEGHLLLVPQWRQTGPELRSLVVVRVDLRTGERSTIESMPRREVIRWFADHTLAVRAALVRGKGGSRVLLVRDPGEDDWCFLRIWTAQQHPRLGRFSRDGKFILLTEDRDTDRPRMGWLNLANGDLLEIFTDPDREPVGTIAIGDELVAVASEHARRRWRALDATVQADLDALESAFRHDFEVTGQSEDGRRWLVRVDQDLAAARTFLYDRRGRRIDLLGVELEGLLDYTLAPMRAVTIPARDGLELVSYLTRPPGAGERPTPLVLLVHGGPESRDHWGFDRWVQFLASRGYSVLQVNFRGSAGFGRAFALAGYDNRVGGKTPRDLADALAWAKTHVPILTDRVAVMGLSYGGYAALASLASSPGLYACGVDGFGPSNLLRQNALTVAAGTSLDEARDKVFDPRRAAARAGSPLRVVDAIRAPVLVIHGGNDPRVRADQSGDFVDELRAAGGCAEYVLYPDEGHGLRRQANRIDFARRLEAFLARHLCGPAGSPAPVPGTSAEPR